jgi:predicted transcriptional regulator
VDTESEDSIEPRREQILAFIKSHPGSHLRQIKRELGLAMGVTQYHLYALERERKITSRRRGLYKRFYPVLKFAGGQLDILDVLSQETERDMLLFLIQKHEVTQKQLSECMEISPGSINWHVRRLSSAGLVGTKRQGTSVKYSIQGDYAEILVLLRNYHPMVWERWAARLADAILEISETRSPVEGSERD